MQAATTWKDKITDHTNPWLSAIRSEEDGHLSEASVLYLGDASQSLRQSQLARAALSCSCAASCLERTGKTNAARNLYFEAAKLYEESAEAVFGRSSIREALWLLQEAYDHYVIGGDADKASRLYDRCASLAKKSSPFVTDDTLDKVLRIRRDAKSRPMSLSPEPQTSEVNKAIEEFLRLRDDDQASKPAPKKRGKASAERPQRRPSIEKSIVS